MRLRDLLPSLLPPQPVAEPPSSAPLRHDALFNALTGLGGNLDKGATARPTAPTLLTDAELTHVWNGDGIGRRAIDIYAGEAVRPGWESPDPELDRALRLRAKLRQGLSWGALYGRAVGWIVLQGGGRDLTKPPEGKTSVRRIEIFDGREISPVRWGKDPTDDCYSRPDLVQISPVRPGGSASFTVHASRLIFFGGAPAPPSSWHGHGWTDRSWVQVWWDQIRHLGTTMQGGATLAQELQSTVVRITGLADKLAGSQRAAFLERMRLMKLAKGLMGFIMLGPDDAFETSTNPPTGFRELSDAQMGILSMVTGIPRTRLLGESLGGLNKEDTSGDMAFQQSATDWWDRLVPELDKVYRLHGIEDPGELTRKPSHLPTPREQAETDKLRAEADEIRIRSGVLTYDHVARSRFGPDRDGSSIAPIEEVDEEAEDAAAVNAALQKLDAEKRWTVPEAAQNNAKRVLRWREEHPDEIKGMTAEGWGTARMLASGSVDREKLGQMAAFERHRKNYQKARAKEPAKPWTEPAIVAWLGWGGSTGVAWAQRTLASL